MEKRETKRFETEYCEITVTLNDEDKEVLHSFPEFTEEQLLLVWAYITDSKACSKRRYARSVDLGRPPVRIILEEYRKALNLLWEYFGEYFLRLLPQCGSKISTPHKMAEFICDELYCYDFPMWYLYTDEIPYCSEE